MRIILFFIGLWFGTNAWAFNTISAKVIGVKDGDTYEVLIDNTPVVIRLEHVDCPEKKQPYGTQAKRFGSHFCFGREVQIKWKGKKDRNGRWIAEIYVGAYCLNKELVRNGFAWHFKKYSKSREYAELEIEARGRKIGLWADSYPIAPWDWRKMK